MGGVKAREAEASKLRAAGEELRLRVARAETESGALRQAHAQARAELTADVASAKARLAEHEGEHAATRARLAEKEELLRHRTAQLVKATGIGARLQDIQNLLGELGTLEAD